MILVSLKGKIIHLNEQLDQGAVLKYGFHRHSQALTTSAIIFCLRFAAPSAEGERFLSFHMPVDLLKVITSASALVLLLEKNYWLSFLNADIQRESFIALFQQHFLTFRGKVRISPIFFLFIWACMLWCVVQQVRHG